MAKNHGARQQKRVAKQKAKRAEKRIDEKRRTSVDPAIRLQRVAGLPIVHSLASDSLWEDGIGTLILARQEAEGRLIFAFYLVDVFCLGVKNALWKSGTPGDFKKMVEMAEEKETLLPIAPACLVKIVQGAIEYAKVLGFPPHHDYRHAGRLLEGIDSSTCTHEYNFGKDGKPLYIQGPNESYEQALAISKQVWEAGGDYVAVIGSSTSPLPAIDDDPDEIELFDEDGNPIELP